MLAYVLPVVLNGLAACKFPYPPDVEGDAGGGGPVDAVPTPAFDIAYPSDWRVSVQGPVGGFVLVINTSATPLSLSTFHVRAISDDHPVAVVRVTAPTSTAAVLTPGTAGGALSGAAEGLYVASSLVTEPWVDRTSDLLSLELLNAPVGTYDIAVDLIVGIEDLEARIPMTVHVVPGPTVFIDPLTARRLQVFR